MKAAIHPIKAPGLRSARRCTCSYCRMRGAITVSADLDGINSAQGSGEPRTNDR